VSERGEAVRCGVARLVGDDPEAIAAEASRVLLDPEAAAAIGTGESPFGDGRASARIVGLVRRRLAPSKSRAIRA
jgi:UDP-N-acetylglucosamine 2-epimerase (non-hydrolysing)